MPFPNNRYKLEYWITKEGKNIPFEQIPDTYFNNIVKMLDRKGKLDKPYYSKVREEIERRKLIKEFNTQVEELVR